MVCSPEMKKKLILNKRTNVNDRKVGENWDFRKNGKNNREVRETVIKITIWEN